MRRDDHAVTETVAGYRITHDDDVHGAARRPMEAKLDRLVVPAVMRHEGIAPSIERDLAVVRDLGNLLVENLAPISIVALVFDGENREGWELGLNHFLAGFKTQGVGLRDFGGSDTHKHDDAVVATHDLTEQFHVAVVKVVDLEASYDDAVAWFIHGKIIALAVEQVHEGLEALLEPGRE